MAAPLLAAESRRGRALSRVVLAGLALGALWVAGGIFSLADLGSYVGIDASNGLFASITIGLLVGALGPWPMPLDRASWLMGLPVIVGSLAVTIAEMQWPAFLLGVVLGALPLFAGLAIPGARREGDTDLRAAAPAWRLAVTLLIALAEPLVLMILLPVPWLLPRRRGWPDSTLARRALPLASLALLAALCWLALTVAGTPWARLGSFAASQPLSIGAERLLAVFGIGALLALLAPWPLGRLGPLLTPIPAIVVLGYRLATTLAPQGVAAWLPGTALLLVPSALIAGLLGKWRTCLGSMALLGALTGSGIGLAGAILLALVAVWPSLRPGTPDHRVRFFVVPWRAVAVGAGVALVVAGLLEVEVVMATCLAAGCATILARVPRVVPSVAPAASIPES